MKRSMWMSAALSLGLAACANGIVVGMSQADVSVQVPGGPAQALASAKSTIVSHGYAIGGTSGTASDGSFVTTPRPVPADAQPAGSTGPQVYVLQLNAGAGGSLGGSTVRVMGYRVPAAPAAGSGSVGQAGMPITTADKKLFEEVRNAAKWVRDSYKR